MAEEAPPTDVANSRQQQHTGNHDKPGPERSGSERHGGTRHGAENVDPASTHSDEKKPDNPTRLSRVIMLDIPDARERMVDVPNSRSDVQSSNNWLRPSFGPRRPIV